MNERVMVLAVHPDDETLGCGGTLLKHKARGDEVYWGIVTAVSEAGGYSRRWVSRRAREIKRVERMYGFDCVVQFGVPTRQVTEWPLDELVGAMSGVFQELKPTVVYLPFMNDAHSDHRRAFEAAYSCTKTFRHPSVFRVLMMETLSETDNAPAVPGLGFQPNVFVDISEFLEKKLEIMRVYADELGEHPFPRSETAVRALATLRGATAGCVAAEGFMLLKDIWR